MVLPIDMYFVRHGQSEGNVANKRSRAGNNSDFTEEFRNRHSSTWRLSDLGIDQALAARDWFKNEEQVYFDRYTSSSYLRAMETAALLGLPNAEWKTDYYLRERYWGQLDILPDDERKERFRESLQWRNRDAFYWRPEGGESLAETSLRVDRALETHHRSCSDGKSVCVCHGEIMWLIRIRLERLTQSEFLTLDESKDPFDHIHNCQILHYSRRDEKGLIHPHMVRMRSICPWDQTKSSNDWKAIKRKSFRNEDLLNQVNQTVRTVN